MQCVECQRFGLSVQIDCGLIQVKKESGTGYAGIHDIQQLLIIQKSEKSTNISKNLNVKKVDNLK